MEANTPKIAFDLDGSQASIRPLAYLGNYFSIYKRTCDVHGARSCKDKNGQWQQVCKLDQVPALVEALRANAFVPVLTERLVEATRAKGDANAVATSAAAERLTAAESRLEGTGLALYAFQRAGVHWLAPREAALLADEQGLGKTVQLLIAAPEGAAVLAVVPAIVKGNWIREARRWRPDLRPVMLSHRGSFRWPQAGEIVVVNYDLLPACEIEGREHVLPATLGKPAPGTILLVDEIHKAKNRKAKRTVALKAIRKAVQAEGAASRAWGASGTPLLNRQSELWNVLDVLGLAQDAFSSWKNFLRIAGGHEGRYGIEWSSDVDVDAMRAAFRRVGLRRTVDETIDLPPKVYRDVTVEIDAATRRSCDAMIEALKAKGIDFATATQDALSGGVAFEELSRVRAALATAKIPALLDLVEEFEEIGEPLIVFSAHRAPVEALGEREGWATILGGLDAQRRTDIVADFEAGKLKGIALTIGAGAEGITLNRARRMLFVDLAWTPALNAQAEARFRRIGQTASTLFVDRLVADHDVDLRVLDLLSWKGEVIEKAVEAGRVDGRQALAETGAAAIANALDGVEVVAEVEDAASVEQRLRAEREAGWKRERAEREARWAKERAEREAKRDALNAKDRERRENEKAPKRAAASAAEEWAARACLTLSARDPDRAAENNGVGWSASDGGDGHRLAHLLAAGGELTERDWKLAVGICGKYWRQVGRRPDANDGAAA
jgi:hypothetical protein